MKCPNCGRGVFGFWKYGPNNTCCMKCFREMVADGRIRKIPPYTAFPELGIIALKIIPVDRVRTRLFRGADLLPPVPAVTVTNLMEAVLQDE